MATVPDIRSLVVPDKTSYYFILDRGAAILVSICLLGEFIIVKKSNRHGIHKYNHSYLREKQTAPRHKEIDLWNEFKFKNIITF